MAARSSAIERCSATTSRLSGLATTRVTASTLPLRDSARVRGARGDEKSTIQTGIVQLGHRGRAQRKGCNEIGYGQVVAQAVVIQSYA